MKTITKTKTITNMRKTIYSILIGACLICASCTTTPPRYQDFIPEQDMFSCWYQGCYNKLLGHMNTLLSVNEYLVAGDTLAAQQRLVSDRLVVTGLRHPLDSVGTVWTVFNTSGKDTVCTLVCSEPSVLTYTVPYDSASIYRTSPDIYGCNSHYTIRLTHPEPRVYYASGSGYVNTDGSADLMFEMNKIRIGNKGDGKLTLRGYAHKYDSTVVYHYTFYDYMIVCDESKERVY